MRGSRSLIAGLAIAVAVAVAGPTAAENVLRFTGKDAGAATMDPHSYLSEDNKGATIQVYEALLDVDSNLAVVPQLAVAWNVVDSTNWEFELRQNVRFHDGTPFTAEDVIFSIERAQADTSDFQHRVNGIAALRAIDDHTVRITTAAPDPSLWLKLADITIMSKAWAQEHDVTKPADFVGARAETYASRHANGTGPFVLASFEPRGGWALVRNPDWWGAADYPHNIDRVEHVRKVDPENVAALLAGEIDLLQIPPYWALDQIRSSPDLKLAYRTKLHTMFFGLDLGSPELRSSSIKGRNPFKDKRVRQAMAHAMDMEPVLTPLMGELYIPAGMIVAPGVNGYAPDLDQPLPFDPKKAKALLVEAGYPNGFSVTLDCANDWGDDEIAACEGMAEQLGAVGIEVAIDWLSTDEYDAKVYNDRESDFRIDGWHMDPDSEELLKRMYGSQNELNVVGYANPRIDELIGKIESEMVTYARDAYLEEAWRIVTDDVVYLPIRHGVSVFAMRKELDIPPDPWDVPRFRLARFKTPKVN
ncbi:MAG TPA: ABC transporter substrate-binding protein [Geminicoccaceae bacterium]|nr:ABC transporter substrate-binding protein [Geminicoccaceae bacterium]